MSLKAFRLEESATYPSYYLIKVDVTKIPFTTTRGSLNVIPARLMNLTYGNYLRFCRDVLGAEIYGKNSLYPVAYFKRSEYVEQFLDLLNARAEYVIFELEYPEVVQVEKEKNLQNF